MPKKYILKNMCFKSAPGYGEVFENKVLKETHDKKEMLLYAKELLELYGDKRLDYHIGVNCYKILDLYEIVVEDGNKKDCFSIKEFCER